MKLFYEVYLNEVIARKRTLKRYKKGDFVIIQPEQLDAKHKPFNAHLGLLYKVLFTKKNNVFVKQVKYIDMLPEIKGKIKTDNNKENK